MSFRLSIVQQPLAWQDAAANRAHFASVLAPLAGNTDLVILPEMFTTGFTMKPQEHAEPAAGETRAWLLEQALRLDAAVGGSVAVHDEGRYFNRWRCRAAPPTGTTSATCSAWPVNNATTKAATTR
jgi:predicted amidohydrolase